MVPSRGEVRTVQPLSCSVCPAACWFWCFVCIFRQYGENLGKFKVDMVGRDSSIVVGLL